MTDSRPTHLAVTFAEAERFHPDVMESYSGRLIEAQSADDRRAIMESGLRETFRRRHPMPEELWPKARQTA